MNKGERFPPSYEKIREKYVPHLIKKRDKYEITISINGIDLDLAMYLNLKMRCVRPTNQGPPKIMAHLSQTHSNYTKSTISYTKQ